MWNILADGFNSYMRETPEVTALKNKLANVSCKCVNCKRARPALTQPSNGNNKDPRGNDLKITGSDKETKKTTESIKDIKGIHLKKPTESTNVINNKKSTESYKNIKGVDLKRSSEISKVNRGVYLKRSSERTKETRDKVLKKDAEVQAQVQQISRYVPGTEIVYDKNYNCNADGQENLHGNTKLSNAKLSSHCIRDELVNQIFIKDQNSQTNGNNNCCLSLNYEDETTPTDQRSQRASVNEIYRRFSHISPEEHSEFDPVSKHTKDRSKEEDPEPNTVDVPLTIEEHIQTSEQSSMCEQYASVPIQVHMPTAGNLTDFICPFCAVMGMNYLPGSLVRVMKDEESETQQEMFRREQAAGPEVIVVDKCMSAHSNSDSQIEMSVRDKDTIIDDGFLKRKSKVSFAAFNMCDIESIMHSDSSIRPLTRYHEFELTNYGCSCMNNYINSIRPPTPAIQSLLYNYKN